MLRLPSRVLLPCALIAAATAGCAARGPAPGRPDAPSQAERRATRILDRHAARHEFPGAALALRDPSGAAFTVAAGVAEPARRAPVDPATPWGIGSVTKTFVAVVVLQLAREGRLDLDAPIAALLAELPLPSASRVTARQLLQHTSGLGEYLDADGVRRDARRAWSARELVAVAAARGPVSEPGVAYHYSNANYLVLGELVERATSRPWHAEVRTRILEPLGLRSTGYAGEPSAPRIGAGHVLEDGRFVDATDRWHPSLGGAAGGMYSTVADLLAFTEALFEGDLLDARRRAEMQAFVDGEDVGHVRHAYGLGLERYRVNDLTVLGHMGNASAHGAFIGYDPARRAAVAVQINAANPGPAAIMGAELLGALGGKDTSPPPMPSASVGYTFFPHQALARVGTGERVGDVQVTAQRASVSWPLVANGGQTRLELSLSYQRLQFEHRGFTHPMRSVQAFGVTAFLRQRMTDAWGVVLVASPGYADDLEGRASMDAVTSTFVAAGTYRVGDDLEVGLGAAVQNVFGEPLPLPVASVDWRITDRLRLESILPIRAQLTWLPIDALGLRASVRADGGSFHGAERVYGVADPQMNYSAVAADLGARWFVLPFLHVTVHGGYTLHRRFEFSDGRDPVPGGEYDLANGMVFGVDVGFGG